MTQTGSVAAGDNNSSNPAPDIGFDISLFGSPATSILNINTNGNATLDGPLTPVVDGSLSNADRLLFAPFMADVNTDTGTGGGGTITYGTLTVDGFEAFAVTWSLVQPFELVDTGRTNTFQMVLINTDPTEAQTFDLEFNYDAITWDSYFFNDASTGFSRAARVGYSSGNDPGDTTFELTGSGVAGTFLDSNLTDGLIYNSLNSEAAGRYVFSFAGVTVPPSDDPPPPAPEDPPPPVIPEPAVVWSLPLALAAYFVLRRRRQ